MLSNQNSTRKISRGLRVLPPSTLSSKTSSSCSIKDDAKKLTDHWKTSSRWKYTKRNYSAVDVLSLQSSPEAMTNPNGIAPKCSYSHASATKLYKLLRSLHEHGGYSRT